MIKSRYLSRSRRLFTRRRSRITTTLLALAAIVVTGCTQQVAQEPPRKDYSDQKVEWVAMNHTLPFGQASAKLSAQQMAGINAFLDRIDARTTDQIALDPGLNADRELSVARADTISQRLRRRLPGVRVMLLSESGGGEPNLVVGRYVVIPPECSGWMSPEQRFAAFANPDNRTDGNYGCSTAANFAAMVANPGDLVRGRDLTAGDGTALSTAVGLYRKGESPHPHSTFSIKGKPVE